MRIDRERVAELLAEALDRPAAGRERFVSVACGEDDDLRAEVVSLLGQVEPARRFFDEFARELRPATPGDTSPMEGRVVGRYRVGARVGVGGMSEIYAATDTTLERTVALKFLAPGRAVDPAAKERLYAEARAVAALEHPNICAVYEVGEAEDGRVFIAMPYYRGLTLKALLSREKRLAPEEVVAYGAQIAAGLAAAHEHGIVHRDLKPSNVMITPEGVARLLDFGIATRRGGSGTRRDPPFGTPAYMAPERIRGDSADQSSDLWSLGVVLHEMLVGEPPFQGTGAAALTAAIRDHRPQASRELRADVPEVLDALVRRCLSPEAGERPTAQEAAEVLSTLASPSPAPSHRWIRPAGSATIGAAVLAVAAASLWRPGPPAAPGTPASLSVPAPATTRPGPWLDLSSTGDRLAVIGAGMSPIQVYDLGDGSPVSIAGSEGADTPLLSPDGRSLLFRLRGGLFTKPLDGGSARRLTATPAPIVNGVTRLTDDRLVAGTLQSGLHEVVLDPDSTASWHLVAAPDPEGKATAYKYPQLLPGGRSVLVEALTSDEGQFPATVDLETGEVRLLSRAGRSPHYAEGYVLYVWYGLLYAVRFDPETLEERGPHLRLPLEVNARGSYSDFDVEGRTLAYIAPIAPSERLLEVSRDGTERWLVSELRHYVSARYSSDGQYVVGASLDPELRSWVLNLRSASPILTVLPGRRWGTFPEWGPGGRSILYTGASADLRGGSGVWETRFPELDDAHILVSRGSGLVAVSPDGDWMVYSDYATSELRARQRSTGRDIFVARARGLPGSAFSPDGRYLAYVPVVDGREELVVRPFPGPGEPVRVSEGGGFHPRWSRDGRELLYRDGRHVIAVEVETRPDFRVVGRDTLFADVYDQTFRWDVRPDGKRFLMARPWDPYMRIVVVRDWLSLLDEARPRKDVRGGL